MLEGSTLNLGERKEVCCDVVDNGICQLLLLRVGGWILGSWCSKSDDRGLAFGRSHGLGLQLLVHCRMLSLKTKKNISFEAVDQLTLHLR